MTLASRLRSLKTRFDGNQPRRTGGRPASHKPATARPRLEPLEGRLLLSGFGTADGAYVVEPWFGSYFNVQTQQSDQKIVVAGDENPNNNNTDTRLAIARYDSLGNSDNSFGSGGPSIPPLSGVSAPALGPGQESGIALVLQPDGKAVVSGENAARGVGSFAVARFGTSGTLDSSFGSGGWTSLAAGPVGYYNPAQAIGLQSTGKIVVAGVDMWANNNVPTNWAEMARFTARGALDSGSGGFGPVSHGKAPGYFFTTFGVAGAGFRDLVVQPDDTVAAVGFSSSGLIVARYTANGTLDSTFNGTGYYSFLPSGITNAIGTGVAPQSDGKLVVSGWCTGPDGASDMLVARFNTNGTVDTSFGGGSGYVLMGVGGTPSTTGERANSVVIQPDGKLVLAGLMWYTGTSGTTSDVVVARFNADGTPDTTFAPGGFKIGAPLPDGVSHSFSGEGVALLTNGDIIVAGFDSQTSGSTTALHPLLMRFYGTASGPMMAAGAPQTSSHTAPLTLAQSQPVSSEAVASSQAAGADVSGLWSLDGRITNLPDATPDNASGNTITLDSNAAGWVWSVGWSSRRGRVPQANRMDLLSALTTRAV